MTPSKLVERAFARLSEPAPLRRRPPRVLERSFSAVGLVFGLYFFAISLTPSLLPRDGWAQGLNSGVAYMIGYGLGASTYAVMQFLRVPQARGRVRAILLGAALSLIALQATLAIWAYVGWQNDTRLSFGMDPLSPLVWPVIVVMAAVVAVVILVLSRLLRALFRRANNLLNRWLPRPLAVAVTAVVLVSALWWVASGAFVNAFFTTANWVFSSQDQGNKPNVEQPTSTLRSGGPESLVEWEQLGRQGREFVWTGPTVDDLNESSGGGALEPIRVYAGLRSGETLQDRADVLLEELKRTGAFEREILVLATTTGTGFIDSRGTVPLEYLWNGDTAIAGVQYSYLPSWISLLADQERVRETSRVVFTTVHDHWLTLPQESRPRLYLYGLSLGSTGVESVLTKPDILNEPIDGALMAGPPSFVNNLYTDLVAGRDERSAPWSPLVGDGRTVRFTTEDNGLMRAGEEWGPTRLVYLHHGSDPVVWFSPRLAFERPEWLEPGQRAPDVSDTMAWYPLVTFWQVLLDMPASESVPEGFGHLYTYRANLDAWVGLTQPEDWTEHDSSTLAALIQRVSDERDEFRQPSPD